MKILKVLSFIGIGLSLFAHVLSWMSPDLLHFAVIGVPLQLVSMILMAWLYHQRVMPLQPDGNLRWWHHTSSLIHGIIFLSVLSFAFQGAMFAFRISSFLMFMIRALSSIWLYTFSIGYGYSSWASRYGGRKKDSHRQRFQNRAQYAKPDIHTHVTVTPKHRFGKHFIE